MGHGLVPIGKAKVIKEGSDITLVTFSITVKKALEAAEILLRHNIKAEVIDLRTIRPMDKETIIRSVKKTNRIISIEEGWPQGGVGAEISSIVQEGAFDYMDAPAVRITGSDVPMPYAENLEKLALPTTNEIVIRAKELCYK